MLSAVVASVVGCALDLFDLFILLYVTTTVGQLFFASQQLMFSIAAVYASFAVTLLMRPFGSTIFGSFADHHGRRDIMAVSVVASDPLHRDDRQSAHTPR